VDIADSLYLLLLYEVGYRDDEVGFVYLIRYLSDDKTALAVAHFIYLYFGADYCVSLTRAVRLFDAASAHDDSSRRIVGSRDIFHKLVDIDIGVVEKSYRTVDDLAQVVGRDTGRHTDRYTV